MDGWHPRQCAFLSHSALEALGWLFALYEYHGQWNPEQANLLVNLLPKPDGDQRPILFRSGFRVWTRLTQGRVKQWAHQYMPDSFINNAAGRRPGDAVWRSLVRSDLELAAGRYVIECLWDVSKAFDRVPRDKLVHTAVSLGYPMELLRLSLASYEWQRTIIDGRLAADPLTPTVGIGPGSGFATYELAALLLASMRALQTAHVPHGLNLHVDDLGMQVAWGYP